MLMDARISSINLNTPSRSRKAPDTVPAIKTYLTRAAFCINSGGIFAAQKYIYGVNIILTIQKISKYELDIFWNRITSIKMVENSV